MAGPLQIRQLHLPAFAAGLLGIVALLLGVRMIYQSPARVAEQYRRELEQAIEPEARDLLDQLAALPPRFALPHLVQLLDDDREAVRDTTWEILRERVQNWLRDRRPEDQQALAILIHELASQPLPRHVRQQEFAKGVAMRLVDWPMAGPMATSARMLDDCTSLLERLTPRNLPERIRIAIRPEPLVSPLPVYERVRPSEPLPPPDLPPVAPFDSLSPAPQAMATDPESPPAASPETEEPATTERPPVLPIDDSAIRMEPERFYADEPQRLPAPPANPLSQPAPDELVIEKPELKTPAAEPALVAPLDPPEPPLDLNKLRALTSRALIRHLHGLPKVEAAAVTLLRERGFDDDTLTLARKLDDPDPQVRRELVEALPGVANINAAGWLLELTHDRDDEIRRSARSILSTSRNPFTKRRLEFSQPR